MNNELPKHNHEPEKEIDVLALFEYFKRGIKSIFKGIVNLIKGLLQLILSYLLLLKKYIIIVLAFCIGLTALAFYKADLLGKRYKYQMIVEPQLNSIFALEDEISSLNTDIDNDRQLKALDDITKITIRPIKKVDDEVRLYYDITENYSNQKDSTFYQTVTLQDFKKQIKDQEYPLQVISVYSVNPIQTDSVKSLLLDPIISNPKWIQRLNDKKQRIEIREKNTIQALARIDSLLYSYQMRKGITPTQSSINIGGENTKNNVEEDLLNQINSYTERLDKVLVEKSDSQDVIKVVSDLKRVENDSIRSLLTPKTGILWGLLISSIIILMIELFKYLNQVEKKKKAKECHQA